ncbi:MAG TPA: LuxR family transcriptional regulator [Ktedonobacteraceae bacterium]|nr:LuxR family transcriptional regulator [Ktedonobacteraceae bacterium]
MMPKLSRPTLLWSPLNQRYELSLYERVERHFSTQDEEAFSTWLRAQISFAFVGQSGRLSVLKEARARGNGYWYAYRKQDQHTRKGYLGPSSQVTFARLEELASSFASLPHASPLAGAPSRPVPERMAPLLSTKLVPPRLPGFLVERPRLLRDLDMAWTLPLTLVSSSAGSGKTTLLSAWANQQKDLVAWLSLDSLDTDPTRFWTACIIALRRCLPTFGEEALTLLHAPQSPPLSTILTMVLNGLVIREQKVILILDDFHVISHQAISASLLFLLEHLPASVHLVLATRTDPELPLSRLRVREQLLELRFSDLRFTQEETARFLVHRMNLPLSEVEVAMLENRTEGWIAGLQLAALSLSHHPNPSHAASDFGGAHRYLLDYVQQDILARLPGPLQDFLLQTSVVGRMNAALCQAVLVDSTRQACQHMLEEVERANLFVVPLDAQRQWYRYHDLFREALQARLQASHPELVPLLHVRVARWYETQGELREAIVHALFAADYAYAAALMQQAAPSFWLQGEVRTVHCWTLSLPDPVLRTNLRLALSATLRFIDAVNLSTSALRNDMVTQVVQTFSRLDGLLREKQRWAFSKAELAWIERRFFMLQAWIELSVMNRQGDVERLRQVMTELEAFPLDEETSWNMIPLSFALWLFIPHLGRSAALIPRFRKAAQMMREARDYQIAIRLEAMLALALTLDTQFEQARQQCLEGIALLKHIQGRAPWEGHLYYSLFIVSYVRNQLAEASDWLLTGCNACFRSPRIGNRWSCWSGGRSIPCGSR